MSQITKKALVKAFSELTEEKSISKITISDITTRAGVNRHTFYYHFKDINDMIAWNFATTSNELLKDDICYSNWQSAFNILLGFCVERRKYILTIYHSEFKDNVLRLLNDMAYILIRNVLEEQSVNMNVSSSDKDFIARFFQYSFVGVLTNWFDSGMMEEPSKMIRQVGILVRGDFKDCLSRFEQEKLQK